MRNIARGVVVSIAFCMSSVVAQAVDYTIRHFEIPEIEETIVVDGVLDEPHWQQSLKIDLAYETAPDENVPAKEKTTAYLYENGNAIYVAFRAQDSNADAIRAYLRDRDRSFDDDFVGLQIDTFNDEQRSYEFFSNPLGVQMDLLYDEASQEEDDSWDGIWESAGTIDQNGYTVEMVIPFATLRFASGDQVKTWGFEVLRVHPREKRRIYRSNPRDRSRNCVLCQMYKLRGFKNAVQGSRFEWNPILTVGISESRNDAGDLVSDGTEFEPGLNAKWAITPEFSLDATINPDFSQVESDSPQLNVNQTFALFFEEKRPFFQEGSNYFNSFFTTIYTRNVTDPDFGLKLTGRKGKHTIGTFVVQDAITNVTIPSALGSDFATIDDASSVLGARYRYDVTTDFHLGAIATYRSAQDYHNALIGADAFYRLNNRHKISFQYLTSDTENPHDFEQEFEIPQNQTGDALLFRYDYNTRNWYQYTRYRDIDKDFRADLGFITQVDNDRWVIGGGYKTFSENAWWNRLEIGGDWDITHDNAGNVLEREVEARIEVNGLLQSYMNLGFVDRDRLFDNILFDEAFLTSFVVFQPRRGLLLELGARYGERIDFGTSNVGDSLYLNPGIHWSLNRNIELLVHHNYDRLDVEGVRIRTVNLTDFRLTYQMSTRSFIRLTAQYESVKSESLQANDLGEIERNRDVNTQLLYSYKINPRTVFFLGYSDLAQSDDEHPSLRIQEHGIFAKVGYVFN